MNEQWIYVAGPYAQPDPIENTQRAINAAEQIVAAGHTPIVPHLTMLWHLVSPHPADYWYAYDQRVLARCDVLLRLHGESTGADAEVGAAIRLGIPVTHSLPEAIGRANALRDAAVSA